MRELLRKYPYLVASSIPAVLYSILYVMAPDMVDDLWFTNPQTISGSLAERLSAVGNLTVERWHTDMLRLANQPVAFLVSILPRWVNSICFCAAMLVALAAGKSIAGIKGQSIAYYLWLAAFFIALPWYDYLLCTSYLCNYLLTSAIVLSAINVFVNQSGRFGFCNLLLAFLAGWSHEGFSAPMVGGMSVFVLIEWYETKKIPIVKTGLIVSAVAGFVVIFASPVMYNRADASVMKIAALPLWELIVQIGPSMALLFVTIALSVPLLIKRFLRKRLLMLLTLSLAAEVVALTFFNGPRTTWASILFSLVTLLTLAEEYRLRPRKPWLVKLVGVFVVSFLAVHLLYAILMQRSLSEEMNAVVAEYEESSDGIVYYDVTKPKIDLSLLKTSVRSLNETVPLSFISYRYGSSEKEELRILPGQLRNFRGFSNTRNFDLEVYEGLVIAGPAEVSARINRHSRPNIILVDEEGNNHETRCNLVPFTASDGLDYYYLKTHIQTLNPSLKIVEAKFISE